MAETTDRVTRFAADLLDSAAAEGARQRVEAALAGELDPGDLSTEEGVVFDAEIDAAVQQSRPAPTTVRNWPAAASPPSP